MYGNTLELFFIDGKPDGMLTAEVFGWIGHILVLPRTRLKDALERTESSFTGIYILIGEKDGEALVYIGESENISNRIRSHDLKKDWWTKAILITSIANNLHKAHAQYLEAKLVEKAIEVSEIKLENGNNPSTPSLSESAQVNMELFIEQLLMVLPAIKVDIFTSKTKRSKEKLHTSTISEEETLIFELTLKKEGVEATAILDNGDFVVQKGSLARGKYIGEEESYKKLYDKLTKQGILKDQGNNKVFTESYAFSSPSAAGAVCKGYNVSGPTEWKLKKTGQTYKEWEAESLTKNNK